MLKINVIGWAPKSNLMLFAVQCFWVAPKDIHTMHGEIENTPIPLFRNSMGD